MKLLDCYKACSTRDTQQSTWFSRWEGFCLSLLTKEGVYDDYILLLAAIDKCEKTSYHLSHRCLCLAVLLQSWMLVPYHTMVIYDLETPVTAKDEKGCFAAHLGKKLLETNYIFNN